MPVSGLVITLDEERAEVGVRAQLASERGVIVGDRNGRYLPLALESESAASGEQACERLRDLAGVTAVSVVFIDFSETEAEAEGD